MVEDYEFTREAMLRIIRSESTFVNLVEDYEFIREEYIFIDMPYEKCKVKL